MKKVILITLLLGLVPSTLLYSASELKAVNMSEEDEAALKNSAKNLARFHMGTSIEKVGSGLITTIENAKDSPEGALMGDDEALSYELAEGQTSFLIRMREFHRVDSFIFKNYGSSGTLDVSISEVELSADDPAWKKVASNIDFKSQSQPEIEFPLSDLKFVLLTFTCPEKGSIGSLYITGETRLSETQFSGEGYDPNAPVSEQTSVPFDFSSAQSGARVSHVSSGNPSEANNMLDDDPNTSYEFDNRESESAMAIDLGKPTKLQSVSMSINPQPGELKVYSYGNTPDAISEEQVSALIELNDAFLTADASGGAPSPAAPGAGYSAVPFDTSFLDSAEPAASVSVDGSQSNIAIPFEPIKTRYIVIVWSPSPGGAPGGGGFSVSKVSAIGVIPFEEAELDYFPEVEFSQTAAETTTTTVITEGTPETPRTLPAATEGN